MVALRVTRANDVCQWAVQLSPKPGEFDWTPIKMGEEYELPVHAAGKTGWTGKFRVKWNEDMQQHLLLLGKGYFPLSLADLDGVSLTGNGEISWRFNTKKIYRFDCKAEKKVRFEGLTLPVEGLKALAAKVRQGREKR